jgi:hypothetical protein
MKQVSWSWKLRFDEVIKAFEFVQNFFEPRIYKKMSGSSLAFLIWYVDDTPLIGNDIELFESVKGSLNKVLHLIAYSKSLSTIS